MRLALLALALAPLLSASFCDPNVSTARVLAPKLIDTETVTDPQTGETVTLSHWEYSDGVTVTTQDRFKKDTPVTDRRATSRAPLRFAD
jgi:hypothetical protein